MDAKSLLMEGLRSVRRLTREVVAAMPPGEMAYRPTAEQMSFGEQALHILSSYATLLDALNGEGWQWEKGMTLERFPTQEAILALYDRETDRVLRWAGGLADAQWEAPVATGWGTQESPAQLFLDWVVHEVHHRGQMVTYLRLKGITPPRY